MAPPGRGDPRAGPKQLGTGGKPPAPGGRHGRPRLPQAQRGPAAAVPRTVCHGRRGPGKTIEVQNAPEARAVSAELPGRLSVKTELQKNCKDQVPGLYGQGNVLRHVGRSALEVHPAGRLLPPAGRQAQGQDQKKCKHPLCPLSHNRASSCWILSGDLPFSAF